MIRHFIYVNTNLNKISYAKHECIHFWGGRGSKGIVMANLGFHLDTSGKKRLQLKIWFSQIGLWHIWTGFLIAKRCRMTQPNMDIIIPRQVSLAYVKEASEHEPREI